MDSKSTKSRLELMVELIKAVVWPVFAAIILVSFWRPLHMAMDQLPDIINQSDTITVAGLSLKIERNLELKGKLPSVPVKNALAQLSPDDLSTLLNNTATSCYYPDGVDSAKAKFAHVMALGLYKEIPVGNFPNAPTCVYSVQATDLGRDAQKYLYALITAFVQQLSQASPSATPTPIP